MQIDRFKTIPDPKNSLGDCVLSNLTSAEVMKVTIDNKINFNAHVSIITCRAMHVHIQLISVLFIETHTEPWRTLHVRDNEGERWGRKDTADVRDDKYEVNH